MAPVKTHRDLVEGKPTLEYRDRFDDRAIPDDATEQEMASRVRQRHEHQHGHLMYGVQMARANPPIGEGNWRGRPGQRGGGRAPRRRRGLRLPELIEPRPSTAQVIGH